MRHDSAAGIRDEEQAPQSRTATVTVLFTDIEGSTRQWEESPAMFDLVERHFVALRLAIESAGGTVFSSMGDGVGAAFESAEGAVRAAIAAQLEMGELGLSVRMGVHTGEVERAGDDFRGRSVNRAARVMAMARGGQILVSDVAAVLARSGSSACPLELAEVGTHRLRGLTEPERLWQVVHPELELGAPRQLDGQLDAGVGAGSFPSHRTSLVGRGDERRAIGHRLEEDRIVTLTGVGGVGKTRLAIEVATSAPGFESIMFVPLAGVSDPDDIAGAVAAAVGASTVADTVEGIVGMLTNTDALLVVDNCEHVIDHAADVVDTLIARCPRLTVLVTSREVLGIDGEHVVVVRPLDPATSAVELFLQRATAAGADFEDGERSSIQRLCEQLDGLPLAIELAAARAATLGVDEVLGALHDHATLLHRGRRRTDDRHSTLQATIDWSYRLLTPDEQRLFTWLAVFPGGFELDAVRHVAGSLAIDAREVRQQVESLVAKSMVSVDVHSHGVGFGARRSARYRLLETMRTFAFEQLDDNDDRLDALAAMARWMTTIAGASVEAPCTAEVERCSVRLERELDNWREAMLVAARLRSGELAAGLCGPPANFLLLGRHDLADLVEPLLDFCGEPDQRRAVLSALIVSACGTTNTDVLWSWALEVQSLDDARPTGLGGLMRWLALAWRGEFEESIRVCVEASWDVRLHPATRDLFVGIAVLDHFSLTDANDDRHVLVPRAIEIAERTEMALTRISCLLGVAWAVAGSQPARSVELVRRALDDIAGVPPLTRLTLPGSASRLLSRLDPTVAAQALLDQIDAEPSPSSFTDMIPLFYGAALLERLGDPAAAPTLATVTARPVDSPASMMDFVDQARRAAAIRDPIAVDELGLVVRRGLAEIAGVSG